MRVADADVGVTTPVRREVPLPFWRCHILIGRFVVWRRQVCLDKDRS